MSSKENQLKFIQWEYGVWTKCLAYCCM